MKPARLRLGATPTHCAFWIRSRGMPRSPAPNVSCNTAAASSMRLFARSAVFPARRIGLAAKVESKIAIKLPSIFIRFPLVFGTWERQEIVSGGLHDERYQALDASAILPPQSLFKPG